MRLPLLLLCLMSMTWIPTRSHASQDTSGPRAPKLAFIGLHGGVFEVIEEAASELGAEVTYLNDDHLDRPDVDLGEFSIVIIEHLRSHEVKRYRRVFSRTHTEHPSVRILSLGGFAIGRIPEPVDSGAVFEDPSAEAYYGTSSENLRRFLVYLLATYCGADLDVLPPLPAATTGLYHPDGPGIFGDVSTFERFAGARFADAEERPRAVVAVHFPHLLFQQPQVVDAMVHALEERETSRVGLAANELNLHAVSQEIIGGIEPTAAAGSLHGGGAAASFVPIPERMGRIADRALAWSRLRRTPASQRKVAVVYWDREMGKSELMRGSATGMFLNGPRSLVSVLKRMEQEGCSLGPVPQDETALVEWMMDRGRQIGVWNPGVLDALARSGDAVLVPAETYLQWFETYVPEAARAQVIERWGEAPGQGRRPNGAEAGP